MSEITPAGLRFSEEQVDFICEYYEFFTEGRFPPKYSGYIDIAGIGRMKNYAYFESPAIIIAEFHSRLDRCGQDGMIFRFVKCLKVEENQVAILSGKDLNYIRVRIGKVRSYIIGKRKSVSYPEFLRHKKERI